MKSIHRGVWEWLKKCPKTSGMSFSYGTESGSTAILIPKETVEADFNNGTQIRNYSCDLVVFRPITFVQGDDSNIDALEAVDDIAAWMEKQYSAGNMPEMPAGCTISEFSVRSAQTGYAIAQDGMFAKYVVPFTIKYLN